MGLRSNSLQSRDASRPERRRERFVDPFLMHSGHKRILDLETELNPGQGLLIQRPVIPLGAARETRPEFVGRHFHLNRLAHDNSLITAKRMSNALSLRSSSLLRFGLHLLHLLGHVRLVFLVLAVCHLEFVPHIV